MKNNWKQKYDELFRMTEIYIKHLHIAEEENKALREAWEEYERVLTSIWGKEEHPHAYAYGKVKMTVKEITDK